MTLTTGGRALIEVLRGEGVEYVFGIPGATEIRFMAALEEAPDIRYILALHEAVCVGMAEGYARATGKPGFLNLHTLPGVAAASPLLYNAQLGRVPLVVTVGQNDTRLLQRDPHLAGDVVGHGKIHTKWSTELVHARDIPTVVQRAFKMAAQPPTGPVLVSIPQNVLEEEFEFTYRPNTTVFPRLRPDSAALARAVETIAHAERPLILVESGVARCDALDEVVRFAELTGSRVYQGWMSDVNFPVTHRQYLGDLDPSGPQARDVFRDVDVLIGVGCSLFAEGFLAADPPLSATTRIVHIDDDPWEIGKNFPTECGIQGDIKTVLAELNSALETTLAADARREAERRVAGIAREKAASDTALQKLVEKERDKTPVSVTRLMTEIKELMGPDTVIVDECWSASASLRQILEPTQPKSFFRSRKGGSIGSGLPMALGVGLGLPHKHVIAVVGDGSAAWSMQSLWTAARYRIPVTLVITNNATYRQVKLVRKAVLGDYPLDERHDGMELDSPVLDFSTLARSMGVVGQRIARHQDLKRALKEAIGAGEPRLVEVMM